MDLAAIYQASKLTSEELDRVVRGEQLLHLLPSSGSQQREVVDATFRAFGVDRTKIVEAGNKQADALERFIAFSQEQTQKALDVASRRIAELESEIERCRQAADQASSEGEERARTVNNELAKVQRVLDFFGDVGTPLGASDLDDDEPEVPKAPPPAKSPPPARPA